MSDLSGYNDAELIAEIEKRGKKKGATSNKPVPKPNIDWTPVVKYLQDAIDSAIKNDGWMDDDMKYFLYETVIDAVFGDYYWEWRSKNIKN